MLGDLLLAFFEAALIEAREPRLLERNGAIWWRSEGRMVRLTGGSQHLGMEWSAL